MSARAVGFTGSRHGMTRAQELVVWRLLQELVDEGAIEFHHGGCVGSDEQGARAAQRMAYVVHDHPASDVDARWIATPTGRQHEAALTRERNRAIVDACDVLIAATRGDEIRRSGTWQTVRYARERGRAVVIVTPLGDERREGE